MKTKTTFLEALPVIGLLACILSGLKGLKKDMIKPFYQRMTAAGCPMAVKLYPGCGHFPHSDLPDQFADDTVQFVTTGEVADTVDPDPDAF